MTTVRSTTSLPPRRSVDGVAGGALVLVFVGVVCAVAWALTAGLWGAERQPWDGDYAAAGKLASWLVVSVSEPQFYAVGSASVCLLLGGTLGHLAHLRSWRWPGFVQAGGSGIWPWAIASALMSLLLSNFAWGWTLAPGTWQPLFVPLVSVAPAMVVLYGPGTRVGLTASVAGALLTTPTSILAVEYLCKPMHLPLVVGATTGMWAGAIAAFWLCRRLPWMPAPGAWRTRTRMVDANRVAGTHEPGTHEADTHQVGGGRGRPWLWVPRRALADFSEAQFFGNEWASAGLILGAVVAYLVSPSTVAYGSGLLPAVLLSQAITAVAGVLIWRRRWEADGFYPTFVPVVSVAPAAVLAFGGSAQAVAAGALAGALIAPPVAASISSRLPATFHPFIGNVASMSVCTALIVPLLDLVPGFTS